METELTNKKTAKVKSEVHNRIDWTGLAIDSAMWVLQGAMMAAGGAIAGGAYKSMTTPGRSSDTIADGNVVIPIKKSSNS